MRARTDDEVPGLYHGAAAALRRAGEDVDRVATLVERRSSLPRESIIGILRMPDVTEDEAATWFG